MNTFSEIRKQLHLTQAALAARLGVTQGNVAHYERGQTVPPSIAEKLIKVAEELGHSITYNDIYGFERTANKRSRRSTDKSQ